MVCISNESKPSGSRKRHASAMSQSNQSNRCGQILRIHLKNFICHSNLIMDFNRRVNFIVGGNGSGKSAILKALAVGLGIKIRDMKIKQLIKTGEIFATIGIDIDNGGNRAFEHSTYGDKINIVCYITADCLCYNINNEWGRIISKNIDDLHKILLYFNIQVDNPIFGLGHERSYISELNPDINYQLFLKVIELEIYSKGGLDLYNDSKRHFGLHKMQNEFLHQQINELCEEYEILHTVKDIKEKIKRFKLEILYCQTENDNKKLQYNAQQNDFRHYDGLVKQLDKHISISENELNKEFIELEKHKEKAQEMGDRVQSFRTIEELENLIKIFEEKLQYISHIRGKNIDDIEILLAKKRSYLTRNEPFIEATTENICSLKKSHIERIKKIENVKCLMEFKLKCSFEEYLKRRQFFGQITMDHVNKKLMIKFIPRHDHIRNAISRMDLLSSEERSFTVTAFLLSLWACTDHPFYSLDEYDSCTDEVNRDIITRLLLNESERKPQSQYIFLTPQNIYFNDTSDKITIHRLEDPRD